MNKVIRIGTRDSELALWQAKTVQNALEKAGHKTELVPVKSTGDLNLDQPLYEMGITGIFTKTLDVAMIKGEIDIAVHSMKDVPTALPKGIVEAAVLKRANTKDILIHKGLDFLESEGIIATGSLRRKAQWLNKHPNHKVVDLRGNVNTRMKKLDDNDWNGAIFAAAGLERIALKPDNFTDLNWMIPAPAQGAMLVVAMEEDEFTRKALALLNHRESEITVHIEREFLKVLEGGCTAPIGALATIDKDLVYFEGALFSLDGKEKIGVEKTVSIHDIENLGRRCAEEILNNGGAKLMQQIKAEINTEG
ncbi:hydroxymethylbilane synthase [Salegentibacter mishustinae]|uniref:Hydroxymethylbilane synthase n=1 Tax=Salegentibacter mishustinae TaxID=270918 RepID=A0A0Q9Z4G9_9FLAO|nr:hydroxymethylbilane synthase [Salegentibacter mishustinae]KRG27771.1 porphobilinogen deaminase [Salegentibacter mishustinae]PNW20840.1 porphobilinogen deaminase [Salegentibacter mishustinae]PZX64155.1 hydroxymethylbilane synthase [Salegentibacter mishustinae]GGW90491.1 hydroxymethylbilane synthase [Salegentibacter mishustinae]